MHGDQMPNPDLEAFHLDYFLRAVQLTADAVPERSEAPDFTLKLAGRKVGIEHTQFFLPPPAGEKPQQQIEALQNLAVEQARRIFRQAGGPALYVYPVFNDARAPRSKTEAYALAPRLAAVVAKNRWPEERQARTFETWRDLPELHGYTVMRSVDGVDELWNGGSGGMVAEIKPHHVEACLDSKATKHCEYLQRTDEVWLLIVNDGFRGGAPCELGDEAATARYIFPFERVFWLEITSDCVTELMKE